MQSRKESNATFLRLVNEIFRYEEEKLGFETISSQICNDRELNGGGVAIYAKDSLSEPTIKQRCDKLELLALDVKPKNAKSLFFICWYRPPTSSVDETAFENLRETLGILDREGKEIILVGDTNCD